MLTGGADEVVPVAGSAALEHCRYSYAGPSLQLGARRECSLANVNDSYRAASPRSLRGTRRPYLGAIRIAPSSLTCSPFR